jgi:NlpC/P60 family putative phage cell wall peptidase
MTTRAAIVDEATSWLGTPWCHQASLKHVGTDCAGLVIGVARACGIAEAAAFAADTRFRGYGRLPFGRTLLTACDAYLDRIEIHAATLADILILRWRNSAEPMHFAIVTGCADRMYITHALASLKRVATHGMDEHWHSWVFRAYAYRGIA